MIAYTLPPQPRTDKGALLAELCLMLREEGLTYDEIAGFTGYTAPGVELAIEQGKLLRAIEDARHE